MYKIDNKKVFNIMFGALLGSTLMGLPGCVSFDKNSSDFSDGEIVQEHNYNHTALFFDGNIAILIPCDYYIGKTSGFIEISYKDFDSTLFSSSDITIFNNNKNLSSYDQALKFALSLTNEVYNYEDIIIGEYNNIALGVNIENELGITKKKDL